MGRGLISRTVGGGRQNFNGVRFDDKPGGETYWEQAERNMERLIKLNETHVVGLSRSTTVGLHNSLSVVGENTLVVGGAYGVSVGGAETDNVGGAKGINVGGAFMTAVGGYHSLIVGGAHQMIAGAAATMMAGGIFSLSSLNELVISAPIVRIIGSSKLILQGGEVAINPAVLARYLLMVQPPQSSAAVWLPVRYYMAQHLLLADRPRSL